MFPEISQYRKSAASETSCADRGENVPRSSAAAVAAAAGQRPAVADHGADVVQRLPQRVLDGLRAFGVGEPVDQDVHPRLAQGERRLAGPAGLADDRHAARRPASRRRSGSGAAPGAR